MASLRTRFPRHAERVLGVGGALTLAAMPDGSFAPTPRAEPDPVRAAAAALAMRGGLRASFPARGDGAVRMVLPDGFAFAVREVGTRAAGRVAGGAVVYGHGRSPGASFWSPTEGGYEEWLLLPAARAEARWVVEGATLRQRGEAVEVVDGAGVARVTVSAPAAYAEHGPPVRPRLTAAGAWLALSVERAPDSGLVLIDPVWQPTGPPVAARHNHTATLLSSGQVLLAGGDPSGTAVVYDEGRGALPPWTPSLAGPLPAVRPGGTLPLSGTGFTGVSEASGGTTQSSGTPSPLLLLRRLDSEALSYAPTAAWTPPPAPAPTPTVATAAVPATLIPGPYLAWIVANGVLSNGRTLFVEGRPAGASCSAPFVCASGYCADGVCCDAPCTGRCRSCNLVGRVGTCGDVALGDQDPDTCAATSYCDGVGECKPKQAVGAACATPGECTVGTCVDGRCCNSVCAATCMACDVADHAGECVPTPVGQADPNGHPACVDPKACDGSGLCKKLPGQGCTANTECLSGNCADGVCCDAACDSPCTYCNFAAAPGVCTQVPDDEDPRGECQASSGGSAACAGKCVSGQCAYPDVGKTCGLCSACDGMGRCTATPTDDEACGTIDCSGLDTACRAYQYLAANRCATLGTCKVANDPAGCTLYHDLPCSDAGVPLGDGGRPTGDGGTGGGNGRSGGCGGRASSELAPSGLLFLAGALGLTRRRARRRRG